ncbi:hypothetical protein N658DRAFT_490565 [Parathielavia hyrcaniae]|uniref:Uncharacterized protein n=1 Tax=Parathielavia hyrcaniae TaxID=113614 RepID=A0AAN6T6K4_9PEZI|nr:hypothetical protein N658DRAFT_490565 [Parathielavia hyrcaniae]
MYLPTYFAWHFLGTGFTFFGFQISMKSIIQHWKLSRGNLLSQQDRYVQVHGLLKNDT